MKKKGLIIGISAVILVVAVLVLVVSLAGRSKDVTDIIGKEVPLSNGILYCQNNSDISFEDDFSEIYSKAAFFVVEDVDEETMEAVVVVSAPPITDIMEACLPEDENEDFETAFSSYMNEVYSQIASCPKESFISTQITCQLVEDDGLKLIADDSFSNAVFPDIRQFLSELLMELLVAEEG